MTQLTLSERGARGGVPLLLLHAFPLNAGMWGAQLDALAALTRVVALDLPGFGSSAQARLPDNLDDIGRLILDACAARGIYRAIVVGCSMGGYLAFSLMRVKPAFVGGLALVNTKATPDSDEGRARRFALAERVEREGCGFLVSEWPASALSPATLSSRPDVVGRVRELVAQATPHGVAAAQRAMAARPDSTPLLARIRVPTLVVHGLDDRLVTPSEAQAMAAQIPGAHFLGIPTAGHVPPLETPEEVTRELRTLVTEVRAAAG